MCQMAIYIANTGMINSIGYDTKMVHAVWRAGHSAYEISNHMTRDRHLATLAKIPSEAESPLVEQLDERSDIRPRDKRLLGYAQIAIEQALSRHQGAEVPLLLTGPENYSGFTNQLPNDFLRYLSQQTQAPIDYSASRLSSLGRAGVIESLRLAEHYLRSYNFPAVLVGGIDSGQYDAWLQKLDADGRLKTERPEPEDGFVPGDGAAMLLLTLDPSASLCTEQYRFRLAPPGIAEEAGHLYSDHPNLGAGLDRAVKEAASHLPSATKISRLFSSANGESFWAKELGVAVLRSSDIFQDLEHLHPADCYGDIGAATGATLIGVALWEAMQFSTNAATMITTSSDHALRSAVCLIPERISL